MTLYMAMRSKDLKSARSSQVARAKRKLWFRNLIALGFPAGAIQEKCKISIYDGMFDKPNKDGFQRVFHFLFCKLDKEQAAELFRYCFPSFGSSKSTQEFRAVCLKWWKRISEEENPPFDFPRLSNSLLMSPGGPELYKVLFKFTTFVMYSEAKRLNVKGEDDTLLPLVPSKIKGIGRAQIMALRSICHSESVEATQNLQMDKYTDDKVRQLADTMHQQHRADIKTKKSLEQQKKDFLSKLKMSTNRNLAIASHTRNYETLEKTLSARTSESLGSVRAMWNVLCSTVKSTTEQREIIDSILCTSERDPCLDAAKLAAKVPSTLLLQCPHEVYENVGTSLYEAGQLNLVSLVKLFNLCLHLLIEKLHEVGVPNFESQIPYIHAQSKIHAKNIITLDKIREKLQRMIPETKKINIMLEKQVDECYARRIKTERTHISGLPKPQFDSTEVPELDSTTVDLPPISPPLRFSVNSPLTTPTVPHLPAGAKGVLFDIPLPQNFPPSQDPSTRHGASAQLMSTSTPPSLKQGFLQISPHTTTKTSGKDVGLKEELFQRRAMHHIPVPKAKGQAKAAEISVDTQTASSVPSTPVIKRDDATFQRLRSRTPDAMKNLINQVVDFTMLEMSVRPGNMPSEATPADKTVCPPFFDIASQLDISVFESHDKIDRTPPPCFSRNLTSPLIPGPTMKENQDPNVFPPVKSNTSFSEESREPSALGDKTKISADCFTKVTSSRAASSATPNDLYASSHPITPYKLGLTVMDELDFSMYQGLMDVQPPSDMLTADFLLDSSGASDLEASTSVPVDDLIDL